MIEMALILRLEAPLGLKLEAIPNSEARLSENSVSAT